MTEALDHPPDDLNPSDAELIAAVRAGDTAAYGVLYERHLGAARRAAVALVTTAAEREDLIAEAFTRVLRALRAGLGPANGFRPYLLVTLRNAAINSGRRAALVLYDEMPDALLVGEWGEDPVGARIQAGIAAAAFARLPERWQTVLWRTEIEDASPATLARQLGLTANGVAALAYRAREGLRQAYLEQYLPAEPNRACQATVGQLASWVRKSKSRRRTRANRVARHLARCTGCRELADTLAQLNRGLPAVSTAALILGTPITLTAAGGGSSATILTASSLTTIKTVMAGAVFSVAAGLTAVAVGPGQPPAVENSAPPAYAQQEAPPALASPVRGTQVALPPANAPLRVTPPAAVRAPSPASAAAKQPKSKALGPGKKPKKVDNGQHNGAKNGAAEPVAGKKVTAKWSKGSLIYSSKVVFKPLVARVSRTR